MLRMMWDFSQEPVTHAEVVLNQFLVIGHLMSEAVVRLYLCKYIFCAGTEISRG